VLLDVRKWLQAYYTIPFAKYLMEESYLSHGGKLVERTNK
jgi:hypothetical protein